MDTQNPPPIPKPGQISWNELTTPDASAAKKFYGELFGWTTSSFSPMGPSENMPPYEMFMADGVPMPVGGMAQIPVAHAPANWVAYVVVTNIDESLAKAVSLGGAICLPIMEVPTVGRIALIQDPAGARIGLHELAH